MRCNSLAVRLLAGTAILILVAACGAGTAPTPAPGTTPPSPATTSAPASPGPAATAQPEPTPIAGPTGTPRPPGVADLVVRLTWDSDVVVPIPGTTILDDGRVVWKNAAGLLLQRRLTAAGLDWVRGRLSDTGLLDRSGDVGAILLPGAQPQGREVTMYLFRRELEGRRIKITSGDPGDYSHEPTLWTIPPGMVTLADLAHGLQDPDAWIDASIWAGPAETFRPHAYVVLIDQSAGPPAGNGYPADVAEVAWPFEAPIDEAGAPYRQGGQVVEGVRCLVLSADKAGAMADAEAAAGRTRGLDAWDADIGYRWEKGDPAGLPGGANILVTTRPLFPYQGEDCNDAFSW